MGRNCTVCIHSAKNDIDAELGTAQPLREIAAKYGVSKTALHRHWRTHTLRKSSPISPNGGEGIDVGPVAKGEHQSRAKTIAKWVLGIGIGLGLLILASRIPGRR